MRCDLTMLCTARTKEMRLTRLDSLVAPGSALPLGYPPLRPYRPSIIVHVDRTCNRSDGQRTARVALSCASQRPCTSGQQSSPRHIVQIRMNPTCRYSGRISRHLLHSLSGGGRFHRLVHRLQFSVIAGPRKPPSNRAPGTFGRSHAFMQARPG